MPHRPHLRVALFASMAYGLVAAHSGHAQADWTIRGTAVLHRGPVQTDTLPILCSDDVRPELGFITEVGDPEWTPAFAASLLRTGGPDSEVEIVLDEDGARSTARFPAGESGEGYYTAVATVVGEGRAPRMISFTAHCGERLVRGG